MNAIMSNVRDGIAASRMAVVLPTGAGKTVIFSAISDQWIKENPAPILIVMHREELIHQTVKTLKKINPHMSVGIVKAEKNEIWRDVIVASIQSLSPARLATLPDPSLIIVDECHHAGSPSYRHLLGHYPFTPAVGFSATMHHDKGLKDVWKDGIVYTVDILEMMSQGYLCDVEGRLVTVGGLSLAELPQVAGDYHLGSLSAMLTSSSAPAFVAQAYLDHARDRQGLVFTPTVASTHEFCAALGDRGISTASIWGDMPREWRSQELDRFRKGETQVLVNCMVLTEGFDAPNAEVCVIARPTKSPVLYRQMVGRVLRPYPGKQKALVLDIVGATAEHSLQTLANLSEIQLKEVQEGETLLEAVRRTISYRDPSLHKYAVGSREINLFATAKKWRWLKTYKGIYFLRCAENVVFIWPGQTGKYSVGFRPIETTGGDWLMKDVDIDTAMMQAENYADKDPGYARKGAWYKKNAKASGSQLAYARRLGLRPVEGITSRDISDMIDVETVSRLLDPAVGY